MDSPEVRNVDNPSLRIVPAQVVAFSRQWVQREHGWWQMGAAKMDANGGLLPGGMEAGTLLSVLLAGARPGAVVSSSTVAFPPDSRTEWP
jgi:hypothetical protein